MLYVQAGGSFQILLLDLGRLTGKSVHKIDAYVGNTALLAGLHSGYSLCCSVTATKEAKEVVIERLDSHAYAIDS